MVIKKIKSKVSAFKKKRRVKKALKKPEAARKRLKKATKKREKAEKR